MELKPRPNHSIYIQTLRSMTPEQRLQKAFKLSGGSQKQFTDALRVYEVQYQKLDVFYIEKWLLN